MSSTANTATSSEETFRPSRYEAECWFVEPTFFVSEQTRSLPMPELSQESQDEWEAVLHKGKRIKLISEYGFSSDHASLFAFRSQKSLEKLIDKHPKFALFHFLLAECHCCSSKNLYLLCLGFPRRGLLFLGLAD